MIKLKQQHWRLISRRFWGTVFTLVIACAVFIQLGRQAFPLLNDYKKDISHYFGEQIGMGLDLEAIDASWSGLRPKLSLSGVNVTTEQGEPVFVIGEATAELSLLDSIIDGRLAWRQLKFDGFETTLVQAEDGTWAIPGMPDFIKPKSSGNTIQLDDAYDIFLFGRRVNITEARFTLHYFDDDDIAEVIIPRISLDNDKDFHRLTASLDVNDDEAFSMVFEGHGDPRKRGFVANGYLSLKNFPTHRVTSALALSSIKSESSTLDLNLWFRGEAQKGITVRGDFKAAGDISIVDKPFNLPNALSGRLIGKLGKEEGWELTVRDFNMQWPDLVSPKLDLVARGDLRGLDNVRIETLDAGPWTDAALHVGFGDKLAEKIVSQLKPRGRIRNIDMAVTSKEEGYLKITALVEDGFSEAFFGAPALSNINGYVDMNLLGGRFDLATSDGFSLYLPKIYYDPIRFEQAYGQIAWEVDVKKRITHITSGLLKVINPEEEGRGYLNLTLPFSRRWGEQQMTLALGVANTAAKNHKKYVPKTIPKHLYQWLDTSIKEGRVTDVGFIYHGAVGRKPAVSPSIQLYGQVHDGNLVFNPNWPELKGVTGNLTLNNNELDVRIDKALLMGNSVYDANISLVDDPTMRGRALSIRGSVASDVNTAMTLLKNSPIKDRIGSTFDEWKVSGGVGAQVELLIPLNSESDGLSQKIDVSFSKANVFIPEINIEIDKVAGELHYHSNKGIFTEKLAGEIWGKPFTGSITSLNAEGQAASNTTINFSGPVDIQDLYAWTSRPELKFTEGSANMLGSILIPGDKSSRPLEVNVTSQLEGVAIHLPVPFGKAKEETVAFSNRIRLYPDGEQYEFTFDETLRASLFNSKQEAISALIEINNFDKDEKLLGPIAKTGLFDISGAMPYVELSQWTDIKDKYFAYTEEADKKVAQEKGLEIKEAKKTKVKEKSIAKVASDVKDSASSKEKAIAEEAAVEEASVEEVVKEIDKEVVKGVVKEVVAKETVVENNSIKNDNEKNAEELKAQFDVTIEKFVLGALEIDRLAAKGERKFPNKEYKEEKTPSEEASFSQKIVPEWVMDVKSELLAGNVVVPEGDHAITLDLEYLRFSNKESPEDEAIKQISLESAGVEQKDLKATQTASASKNSTSNSESSSQKVTQEKNADAKDVKKGSENTASKDTKSVLADIDISQAVPLRFSTKELTLNGENYGSWNFRLSPIEGGLIFHHIYAEMRGMIVGDKELGAEFIWLKNEEEHNSRFSGVLTANNVADVFEAWNQEKLMESESATIDIDAEWSGAPDEVALDTVKGLVSLDLTKGSFNRGAGSDENGLLRLLALFNFDTIIRRLRLDFSDLAAEGFAYDRVFGSLNFKNGTIFLTDPLIVESSSSYVQLVGTVDVVKEKLDSEMVVTLPVASNVAVATAVVAGLPAALGLYVVSKLFKKQVDRASSFNVAVTGNWENPKVNIKKIFDIDAANRRGQEIKENDLDAALNGEETSSQTPIEGDGLKNTKDTKSAKDIKNTEDVKENKNLSEDTPASPSSALPVTPESQIKPDSQIKSALENDVKEAALSKASPTP